MENSRVLFLTMTVVAATGVGGMACAQSFGRSETFSATQAQALVSEQPEPAFGTARVEPLLPVEPDASSFFRVKSLSRYRVGGKVLSAEEFEERLRIGSIVIDQSGESDSGFSTSDGLPIELIKPFGVEEAPVATVRVVKTAAEFEQDSPVVPGQPTLKQLRVEDRKADLARRCEEFRDAHPQALHQQLQDDPGRFSCPSRDTRTDEQVMLDPRFYPWLMAIEEEEYRQRLEEHYSKLWHAANSLGLLAQIKGHGIDELRPSIEKILNLLDEDHVGKDIADKYRALAQYGISEGEVEAARWNGQEHLTVVTLADVMAYREVQRREGTLEERKELEEKILRSRNGGCPASSEEEVRPGSPSEGEKSSPKTPNDEASENGTSKDETSKDETSKDETPKDETPKDETSKDKTSKGENSKDETRADGGPTVHEWRRQRSAAFEAEKARVAKLREAAITRDSQNNHSELFWRNGQRYPGDHQIIRTAMPQSIVPPQSFDSWEAAQMLNCAKLGMKGNLPRFLYCLFESNSLARDNDVVPESVKW